MTAATISLAFGLLAGCCGAIVFPAGREPAGTSTGHGARADHRTPRDMRELKIDAQGLDLLSAGLKTTGQKWSSDEYQTLSSLQQTSDDGSPPVTAKVDVYPALTTDSPPLVARSRYVSNHLHPPYLHHLYGGDTNIQQETTDPEDQRSEYSAAKWNRYYPSHRQLKKYGPVMIETDVTADGSSSVAGGYNVYDQGVDYGTVSANYEPETLKNPNGGGGAGDGYVGWYSDPPTQSSRPATVVAEVRQPGHKMSIDVHKLTLLAMVKIGLAKLKVLTVIKFLAFLWVKLKLLVVLKGFLFAKFAIMGKLLRLFLLPFLPNLLTWLRNAAMMQMDPAMTVPPPTMTEIASAAIQLRNNSASDPALRRSTAGLDTLGAAGNLLQFMAFVQSAKCAERTACRVSGTRPPSLQSMLANWMLSPLVNYIPNRKLKSYMSTLKEVSDYRLENIFSNPSTVEWLKWCDERYYCDDDDEEEEEITADNLI
ncbi:unnamed protein product [Macrosiphum euphorbiae]|uniref:Uncharacterized protein n=1 Tax=Macrosiphum euphorbiae TaxID=13131 RepID=A0AAV0X494_9HEMI|nr:unnamed protein product [Macrosiphum euphorbiae]